MDSGIVPSYLGAGVRRGYSVGRCEWSLTLLLPGVDARCLSTPGQPELYQSSVPSSCLVCLVICQLPLDIGTVCLYLGSMETGLTASIVRTRETLQADIDRDTAIYKRLLPQYTQPMRSPVMRELAEVIAENCDRLAALREDRLPVTNATLRMLKQS
jgi:hypothetical protein